MSNNFKQTDIGLIPEDWEAIEFESTLSDNNFSRDNLIPASGFKKRGRYPIIDQGQEFIAGYTDLSEKVYKIDKPVILFGDHTRIFKYIDFPFVGGADGVKIFSPNIVLYDSKFYYYALLQFQIPSRGYNRHYKLLKEKKVVRPPLPEQKKIATVLSKIQQAIEKQEQIIKTTQELKKALMQKLFTEGLLASGGTEPEPQKQTEIGPIPESWEVEKLGSLVDFKTGKLNSNASIRNGKYPFFTCSQGDFWIDNYAYDEEAVLLSGNNARAIYSVKYYNGKFNAYQRTYIITIKDLAEYDYFFLKYALEFNLERLRTISIGTSTKYLTLGLLTSLPFIKPGLVEQKSIADIFNAIDKKHSVVENYLEKLSSLFHISLQSLMTGQIRVNDIEFEIEKTQLSLLEKGRRDVLEL